MVFDIEAVFKVRKAVPIGKYSKSAVAIMLMEDKEDPKIVFEERAHFLKKQPGDICLPGGKLENGETPKQAAIREVSEELGIKQSCMRIIGEMDYYISPYNSIIYPFIVKIDDVQMVPNKEEVHHIFMVPLSFFINTEPMLYNLEIGPYLKEDFPYYLIRGGEKYKFGHGELKEYFYDYNGNIIWGFTARIIKRFVEILKNSRQ